MEPTVENSKSSKGPVIIIVLVLLVLLIGGVIVLNRNNKSTIVENTQKNTPTTNTATSSDKTTETKSYTIAEVAPHNLVTDCWMAIEGKVYNVTDFVNKHPGGKAILNGCGKDATVLFNERPTNSKGPHPAQAKGTLQQFYIGDLKS